VFGVEPVGRVLSGHGCKIAPSTYYAARSRPASLRAVRDERLKAEITRVWRENFEVYGAGKVWRELNRQHVTVARCTVARLMRELGLRGARRGRKVRTTVPGKDGQRAGDLLNRDFTAPAPNRRWVADFTYVATWAGVVYVGHWLAAASGATVVAVLARENRHRAARSTENASTAGKVPVTPDSTPTPTTGMISPA
jgi:putative transposase